MALLAGCGDTRQSWENSPQFRHLKDRGMEVPADPELPGTTRVVYHDRKPVQSFGELGEPETVRVGFESGIHVNSYDQDGLLVKHEWQRDEVMKP